MTRDEYREEAILWLHRHREYEKLMTEAKSPEMVSFWFAQAGKAAYEVKGYASLAGLESIEELEE